MEKLALFGGKPVRKTPFPLWPIIGQEEIDAVVGVLRSGHLSTFAAPPSEFFLGGTKIREFENNFSKYHGVKYAIAVNSATAGLHIALASAGIGPGDEVIVTPYSFTSSASSILMHNAIPVFADVDPLTFNIDPNEIEKVVNSRTKAIIVVHLLGNPAEMGKIMDIAKRHNLVVIEDCAQAIGAEYHGRLVGTIGDFGVFSFQESKNIATGEGGMVITNNDEFAEKCRLFRNHGETIASGSTKRSYVSTSIGWNYRMTEIEAAIGNEQLKKLNEFNDIRIENAHYLNSKLSSIDGLKLPVERANTKHVYHIYGLIYDSQKIGIKRDDFVEALKAEGIPCSGGYPHPLYKNPIFLEKKCYGGKSCPFECNYYKNDIDYTKVTCSNAERLCRERALWIPIVRPPCTENDMGDIVAAIKKIIENKQQFGGVVRD
jgi:dTDP-4-amino-4,6-dideoxygalactose transaminase